MSTVAAPTVVVPLTIVVPLATAALLAGANRQLPGAARDVLAVGAATITTVLAAVALAISAHGRIVYWFSGWHPVRGTVIGVDYVVDPMGGALAVLAGALAVAALVYSRRFFGATGGRYPALVLVFVAASVDFAWTGDLFNMFVAFELVAVVGFVLTGYYAESGAPLQGAINFAVTNTFGGLVFLVGLSLLYGHTGTLNMAQMGQSLAARPAGGLVAVAFALLASGFLIKAAVVPWHFWLPDAYGTAPAPACVLFAGVLSELGLFGLARTWEVVFSGALSGPAEHRIRLILGAFGILTALVGTAMSLVETHPQAAAGLRRRGPHGPVPARLLGAAQRRPGRSRAARCRRRADQSRALPRGGRPPPASSSHRRPATRRAGRGARRGRRPGRAGRSRPRGYAPLCLLGGKGPSGRSAGAAHPVIEIVFAVTVVGTSAAILAATARVWRGETTDHLSPAEEEAETPTGSGTTVLLAVPALLLLAALGLGLVPHLADHAVTTATTFADRKGYASAVLDGRHTTMAITKAPAGTLVARLLDLAEAAVAILVGALIVLHHRLREVIAVATTGLRRLHSGHVGDQVTWAVFGLAVLAGLSGIALR